MLRLSWAVTIVWFVLKEGPLYQFLITWVDGRVIARWWRVAQFLQTLTYLPDPGKKIICNTTTTTMTTNTSTTTTITATTTTVYKSQTYLGGTNWRISGLQAMAVSTVTALVSPTEAIKPVNAKAKRKTRKVGIWWDIRRPWLCCMSSRCLAFGLS